VRHRVEFAFVLATTLILAAASINKWLSERPRPDAAKQEASEAAEYDKWLDEMFPAGNWGPQAVCDDLEPGDPTGPASFQPNECLQLDRDSERLERFSRAGQLMAMVRGQQPWDGRDHLRAAEARRILEHIDGICPEHADEVFNLGLYESGYMDRYLRGDWRLYQPRGESCPVGWDRTDRGCYSRHACDPDEDANCIPTSCSYWQIRGIYRGRPSCATAIREDDVSVQWVCDWVEDNWPNVAAYNAGHAGSRAGRAQPYANRVYIGVELLRGRGDLDEWTMRNRRFVHEAE